MKAIYVSNNPGSRGHRMMAATSDAVEWHCLTRLPYRWPTKHLAGLSTWSTHLELADLLREQQADLVVVTQQIGGVEWLPAWVGLNRPQRGSRPCPVVVDMRDPASLLPTVRLSAERGAHTDEMISYMEISTMRTADALLHVSDVLERTLKHLHPTTASTPTFVCPCFTLAAEQVDAPWKDRTPGLVYSGGVGPVGSGTFRDYGDTLAGMWTLGIQPHLQSGCCTSPEMNQLLEEYRRRGVIVHDRVPDPQLTATLSKFRWGLVGFQSPFPLGHGALPNKLFEYLSAGTPVLVVNAHRAADLVRQAQVGLVLGGNCDLDNLGELLRDERQWHMRHRQILQQRAQWTWDALAPKLIKWLKRVCTRPIKYPGGYWLGSQSIWDPYAP